MRCLLTAVLMLAFVTPRGAQAQIPSDVWRTFAERVDVGSELNVRLQDGTRFRATLVGVRDDAILLHPRTRVTVPVQAVPYGAIASLERRARGGVGAGKAAAIGVATGVGAFFLTMFIVIATVAD